MTETCQQEDSVFDMFNPDYTWIGKARKLGDKKSGGGIGLLIRNCNEVHILNDNILNCRDDSLERLWVLTSIGTRQVVIGVVYYPNDNVDQQHSEELTNELIHNISHFNSIGLECLLFGDFNGKLSNFRREGQLSVNGDLLEQLTEVTGVKVLNESPRCKGKITWARGNLQSTIDYVLVSPSLVKECIELIVDEDGLFDVASDHNTLAVHFHASMFKKLRNRVVSRGSKQENKWDIGPHTNWDMFRSILDADLSTWSCDSFNSPEAAWRGWKCIVLSAGQRGVGVKHIKKTPTQIWDEEIGHLIRGRKIANRFYRYWSKQDNADPDIIKDLWHTYLERKQRVHELIRQKEVDRKVNVILRNCRKGSTNSKSYWNMLRRLNKNNNYPMQIVDPRDKTKIINDPKVISGVVREYWEKLGSSNGVIPEADKVKERVHYLQGFTGNTEGLSYVHFNHVNVSGAVKQLKLGKACGVDKIPNEFLKKGGENMINSIISLFHMFQLFEKYPEDWFCSIVKPLHKGGKANDLDNYRGISITSNMYKLYAAVVEKQLMLFLEDHDILGELNGAYRRGRRLEDHIFTLKGICSLRKDDCKKTWLAFLDVSKAFDTVSRDRLFCNLWDLGVQGKAWRILKNLYEKVSNKVVFGLIETSWFNSSNGVKQGCILSPTLFTTVMLDLVTMLNVCNHGVRCANQIIPALLYADDTVLMAESETQLSLMLAIADDFAVKWGLKFNSSKSKVLIVGKRVDSSKKWALGNLLIEESHTYKYLGVLFSRTLTDSTHIVNVLSPKVSKLRGYISSILAKHEDINRVFLGNSLYKHVILPSLLHGCGTWLEPVATSKKRLRTFQYNIARTVLRIKASPAYIATIGDLGWLPLSLEANICRIKYYHYLKYKTGSQRLCRLIMNEMFSRFGQGRNSSWPYCKEIQEILNYAGMDWAISSDDGDWLHTFYNLNNDAWSLDFFQQMETLSTLSVYKSFKTEFHAEKYLLNVKDFVGAQYKFRARTSTLGLNADQERWGTRDSTCDLCSSEREDIFHIFFSCSFYDDLRQLYFAEIEKYLVQHNAMLIWEHFVASSLLTKIGYLIGDIAKQYGDNIFDVFDMVGRKFLRDALGRRRSYIS